MLGNGRIEAQCFDGEKRLAHIRGKMRKKVPFLSFTDQSLPNGTRGLRAAEWHRFGLIKEISF